MKKKKNIEEIIEFLTSTYDFRYNEVTKQTEFKLKESESYLTISDKEFSTIYINCKKYVNSSQIDIKAFLQSNEIKTYNPFSDYLNGLPKWDGTSYIAKLADTVKTHDSSFFSWSLEKWFVAMVACMLEDDITNHQCIILAGEQGIGKSTWIDNLVPDVLKNYYYSGNIDLKKNDTLSNLSSKFLINLDELANLTYKSVTQLKEILTKGNISFRRVWGHFDENYVRRASFIGSVNGVTFLYDRTGNRRFLPSEVFEFVNRGRHGINMNLVFSEALHKYHKDFKYWFDESDQIRVEENNKAFLVISSLEDLLLNTYSTAPITDERIEEILEDIPVENVNDRNNKKKDYQNFRNNEIYLTATDLYWRLTSKSFTAGEISSFGKILSKSKFERIKKMGVYVYKLYPNSHKAFKG